MGIVCTSSSEQFTSPRLSNAVKIRLKDKPRINLELSKEKIKVGDSFYAICKTEPSSSKIIFKWFINDVEITGESKEKLEVKNVQRENHQMKIKCMAENEIGSSEEEISINLDLDPIITKQPQTQYGLPGETVSFSCHATGIPPPRYVWVKPETNELINVGQTLNLKVSEQTEADYACKAVSENHAPVTSKSARLIMKRKPVLVTEAIKTGEETKDMTLQCLVKNAYPGTAVVWAEKDLPLDTLNKKYQIAESFDEEKLELTSYLVITKLDEKDFKAYACFAQNELGSEYKTIEVVRKNNDIKLVLAIIFNFVGGIVLITVIWLLWRRRRKGTNVEFMEEEKKKNSAYLENQDIFKNVDKSVFERLLSRNELVVSNDNFNIDMEFSLEDETPTKSFPSSALSPDASVASSRTVLSFIEDSP